MPFISQLTSTEKDFCPAVSLSMIPPFSAELRGQGKMNNLAAVITLEYNL